MDMATSLPVRPIPDEQWQTLQPLLRQLDRNQSLWLSRFLAACADPTAHVDVASEAAAQIAVLVAYGSETGNCEALARDLAARVAPRGIACEVASLAALRPRQLAKQKCVLLITSTHGDGDPPEPIADFHAALFDPRAPRLPGLRYAVLALGDSSYRHFCRTGQQFDERLADLGAQRLVPRQDCDVDFAEPARRWMETVVEQLPKDGAAVPRAFAIPAPENAGKGPTKQRPLSVQVLNNVRLSAAREQVTHHLELALDVPLAVQPGDAVGILADNPWELVSTVLESAGLDGETVVTLDGASMSLETALREHRNLTVPSPRFLEGWAALSGSEELAAIAGDEPRQKAFLRSHQVRDLLAQAPARPAAQAFVDLLRPLQPRLYDVANSLAAVDDELHLTVQRYRYVFGDRRETGIASDHLVHVAAGASVRLYPHRHARFHLPEDAAAPLVLIADGTGIAPYRAFIQDIRARGPRRRVWLVFAEHRFDEDFLYQVEWQQAQAEGLIERIDLVFHADTPGRRLADPLLATPGDLVEWIGSGAHVYLCGDTERLEACEQALQESHDALRGTAASWDELSKAKRIHRNLY